MMSLSVVARPASKLRWSRTAGVAALAALVAASGAAAGHVARGGAWLATAQPAHAITAPGGASVDPGLVRTGSAPQRIVIQTSAADPTAIRSWLGAHGGTVGIDLPIINGLAATVPASVLDQLAKVAGVVAITADRQGTFSSLSFDATTSQSNFVSTTGAAQAWGSGYLGDGQSVAVIDTGVSPHNDLAGRITWGPDLSGEGKLVDTYGHGTVMANIIAGNGADSAGQTGGAYTGVAPHANIVAVKTAGSNGVVDVSTMLQAMHWVAAYASQYNIKVLSLSWGVSSTQNPSSDPIDYAVERLWRQGITVVVAAGNNGPTSGTITKPGDDPMVISVGAFDDHQNTDPSDDSMPSWSSVGPTAQGVAKPDLVAPGRYVIAGRSLGSYIETTYPKALRAPSYIRGSGTSEATAMTSGLVALLLQAHPTYTPDQVKSVLTTTASPVANVPAVAQGAGRVQIQAAIASTTPGAASWQTSGATGLGSIEASRGGQDVQTVCRDGLTHVINGEIDVRCETWSGSAWTGSAWTGSAWTGSAWTGSAWTGSAWTGSAWTGSAWTGSAWTGSAWTGGAWTSGSYDSFLNAFWGNHPAVGQHVNGEVSDHAAGSGL